MVETRRQENPYWHSELKIGFLGSDEKVSKTEPILDDEIESNVLESIKILIVLIGIKRLKLKI